MTNLYFLKRHGGYFRPNAKGYTTDILEAGLYTKEETKRYENVDSPRVLIIPAEELRDVVTSLKFGAEQTLEQSDALLRLIDGPVASDEIYIEELREAGEDGGGFLGWFARGHHDVDGFCHAVNYGYGIEPTDSRYCRRKHVEQIYYRTVKMEGEDSYEFRPAEGPKPGAWPVTVANIHAHNVDKDQKLRDEGKDTGRRQGLNWVLDFERGNGRMPTVDEMRDWASAA